MVIPIASVGSGPARVYSLGIFMYIARLVKEVAIMKCVWKKQKTLK
jgi:hypothetical protein